MLRAGCPVVVYFVHLFSLLRLLVDAGLLPLTMVRIINSLKDRRFFLKNKLIELISNIDLFLGDK